MNCLSLQQNAWAIFCNLRKSINVCSNVWKQSKHLWKSLAMFESHRNIFRNLWQFSKIVGTSGLEKEENLVHLIPETLAGIHSDYNWWSGNG